MEVEAPRGLLRFFDELQDPRMDRAKLHSLRDIRVIPICAVICGADEWTKIELFGKSKRKGFETFLKSLPNGVHSPDTFRKHNLIHGFNGCAKTTLSPLWQSVDGIVEETGCQGSGGRHHSYATYESVGEAQER